MDDLIERLEYAIARLMDLRGIAAHPDDYIRLSGKIEGVQLALSYVKEALSVRS